MTLLSKLELSEDVMSLTGALKGLKVGNVDSSYDAWKIFTKAKSALQNGDRLENLSWRIYHMNIIKNRVHVDSRLVLQQLPD
jgi:hypothetical protein